jgi:S1-C subfamily serine protease
MATRNRRKARTAKKTVTTPPRMNPLGRRYAVLKRSVVAITDTTGFNFRLLTIEAARFPPIIGTGTVVDERGCIATNAHVIAEMEKRRNEDPDNASFAAYLFFSDGEGTGVFPLHVVHTRALADWQAQLAHPQPARAPDIGFIFVDVRDLPAVSFEQGAHVYEGMEVAFAGFPQGEYLLAERGQGNLVQLGPTLRTGRVAAIQPFPAPSGYHGLVIDALGQPGFSGSAVFCASTGAVIGLVWGGLDDPAGWRHGLTYAVPAHIVAAVMAAADLDDTESEVGRESFTQLLEEARENAADPERAAYAQIPPDGAP